MRDAESVITQATEGITGDLAEEYEVSLSRMYEMLGAQCVYPKTKLLIRAIAACDQSPDKWRIALIEADMMAMFKKLRGVQDTERICAAEVHKESSDFVQAILEGRPKADILKEGRELSAVVNRTIDALDTGDLTKDDARAIYHEGNKHFN